MGIYNCESTIRETVNSIMTQSYQNWELIMCDDGSSDSTYEIASKLTENDNRLLLLQNKKNHGLGYSLNRCLRHASGDYVARMDGDDICTSDRFEKQVLYLDSHPSIAIVSSWMTLFDEGGEWGIAKTPEYPSSEEIVSGNPIFHAPAMIRKKALADVNGYTVDSRMLRVEDVNLWIKLYARGYRAYNIQKPLYCMRNDKDALNRRKYRYRINSTYVRLIGCRKLHLRPIYYIKAFKPMINGLVPAQIRRIIRGWQNTR